MRHGQTDLNKALVMQGRIDSVLNEKGKAQAETIARWFREQGIRLDMVYASPLKRAFETAHLASGGLPVQTDERLLEMDYGPYEGMKLDALAPEVLEFFKDFAHNDPPEGMESSQHVKERVGAFMESLKELAKDKNILITTHAIAMKGVLEYLDPEADGYYWNKLIYNCVLYRTELDGGEYTPPVELVIEEEQ